MKSVYGRNSIWKQVCSLMLCLCYILTLGLSTAKYEQELPVDDVSVDVVANIVVTLKYMDGTTPDQEYIYEGSLPTPSKVGYTFLGWYYGVQSGSEWTYGEKLDGEPENHSVLLAGWTPRTDIRYKVYYQLEDLGADTYTTTVVYSRLGTADEEVSPTVYSYTGFTTPEPQTVVVAPDGSTEVYYKYKRNSYQFTLGASDAVDTTGSTVSGIYEYETPITLKAAAKSGYTWIKWASSNTALQGDLTAANTSFNMPAGAITMTPTATESNYIVTYDEAGGSTVTDLSYTETTDITLAAAPTRTGYTFAGWKLSAATGNWSAKTYSASEAIGTGKYGSITLVAQWTANTDTAYKVIHKTEDLGANTYTTYKTENLTGTTGASISPDILTITGFTAPAKQSTTIAADGSTVVTYQYTRNSYKFTLGTHTGVTTTGSTATGTYEYGATITLKAAAKSGYTWSKWTSSNTSLVASKTTANTTFTMPAGAITMTPSATKNNYTVTYNENGGSAVTDLSYTVSTNVTLAAAPTRTGYTFAGWKLSTATGNWSAKTYSAAEAIGTGKYGSITLVAQWTANTDTKYTVKHLIEDLNADTYSVHSTVEKTGATGTSISPDVLTLSGFTAPAKQSATIAADGSTVVTYKYTRNSYKFTLGTHAGINTAGSTTSGTYEYGATITLKAAAKSGYIWNKWVSGNTSLVPDKTTANTTMYMPAGDISMTPAAAKNEYTITYNENGGSTVTDLSYTVSTNVTLAAAPTRTGYTFAGWKLSTATGNWGAATYSASQAIGTGKYGSITLVAQWTPNIIKLTLNANGGSGHTSAVYFKYGINKFYTDSACTQQITAITRPTRTGYIYDTSLGFVGDGTCGGEVNERYIAYEGKEFADDLCIDIYKDATLTCSWKDNIIKLTLNANGGSGHTSTLYYRYGINKFYTDSACTQQITAITRPTRTGYTYDSSLGFFGDGSCGGGSGERYIAYDGTEIASDLCTDIYKDATLVCSWKANTNTAYKVIHKIKNIGASTYTTYKTENLTGTTGASISPDVLTITGFTAPAKQSATIAADGSTVVTYQYARNSYKFTLGTHDGVTTTGSTATGTYEFGTTITLKATAKSGYTWSKWTSSATSLVASTSTANTTFTMPAGAITMTPSAKVSSVTWNKYSCNTSAKWVQDAIPTHGPTSGYYIEYNSQHVFETGYRFTEDKGFIETGTEPFVITESTTVAEINNFLTGKYIVWEECVFLVNSVTSIIPSTSDPGHASVRVTSTLLASAQYVTNYTKGTTNYGTVTANAGSLPESGTLVAGSATGTYCVIKVGSTYYYYEKAGTYTLRNAETEGDESVTTNNTGTFMATNGDQIILINGEFYDIPATAANSSTKSIAEETVTAEPLTESILESEPLLMATPDLMIKSPGVQAAPSLSPAENTEEEKENVPNEPSEIDESIEIADVADPTEIAPVSIESNEIIITSQEVKPTEILTEVHDDQMQAEDLSDAADIPMILESADLISKPQQETVDATEEDDPTKMPDPELKDPIPDEAN